MANITFNVPNSIATELNQIAQDAGLGNAKQMVIAYLRATIRANRVKLANLEALRRVAEQQGDQDTKAIS